MKLSFLSLISFLSFTVQSQEIHYNSIPINVNKFISGTLVTPTDSVATGKLPLVIFIMGSGPTNRDGNQMMTKNDTFKHLARDLAKKGIASFRYDKRLFKMGQLGISEVDIRFDHFITDAKSIVSYFHEPGEFESIFIAGHSQGSLVGMVTAQQNLVDGFISLAGAAQTIDNLIIEQIQRQAPDIKDNATQAFKELRENGATKSYSPGLISIFKPSIQPFMRSWMLYNPQEEITKLETPILIVQGTKDIQVLVSEAEKLKAAAPNAEYLLIENMNHILKEIKGDDLENQKSYNESWRKVMPEVVIAIATFVRKKESIKTPE